MRGTHRRADRHGRTQQPIPAPAGNKDPFSGAVFTFRDRRGHLLKLLYWDGQGLVLNAKRLEGGHFVWSAATVGAVSLMPAQPSMLTEGIDWRRPARTWQPEMAGRTTVRSRRFCLSRRGRMVESRFMSTSAPGLPTDVAALQAMVLAHAAELAQIRDACQKQDGKLAAACSGIVEHRLEIEVLKARLAKLLRGIRIAWPVTAASEALLSKTILPCRNDTMVDDGAACADLQDA